MRTTLFLCLLLAACGRQESAAPANEAAPAAENQAAENRALENGAAAIAPALPPVEPIPPGRPGGLPDDRTPVSEAPFSETSAQGAANVVQTFFALAEAGRTGEARRLWRDPAESDAFAGRFSEVHAQIGAPGEIEGAAGSLFVDVPVQVYGRDKEGKPVRLPGTATLRRINDVPGSTEEQRKWHIQRIEAGAAPAAG